MSLRPVAAERAGTDVAVVTSRLRAVLQAGTAMSPNMVSYGAPKRKKDDPSELSAEDLQTILDAEDVDDVPLPLREAYRTTPPPLPRKLVQPVRSEGTLYLMPKRHKKFYLRLQALKEFSSDSIEAFNDTAGSGLYGPVDDGDWEEAGITQEDSPAVAASTELLAPLKEVWERIKNEWTERGIKVDGAKYVIEEDEDLDDYKERFNDKYEDHIKDYFSVADNMHKKEFKDTLVIQLDKFVKDMSVRRPDDVSP